LVSCWRETRRVDLLLKEALAEPAAERESESAGPSASSNNATPWALYSLSALSVAGFGAGLGFGLEAKHAKSSLQASCAPACTTEQAGRVHHWTTAANVSFGLGSAALAAAVIVYIVDMGHADAAQAGRASRAIALDVAPTP